MMIVIVPNGYGFGRSREESSLIVRQTGVTRLLDCIWLVR